jgi:release factor glutamine methyltransferase
MGTGSGIQAVTAAEKVEVTEVTAVDINPNALEAAKKMAKKNGVSYKIRFIESNLFNSIEDDFDWIIFNAPYLPTEDNIMDVALDGGPTGNEVISCFLEGAKTHLKKNGQILLVYSSLSNLQGDYGFFWEILGQINLFFEVIYCALLKVNLI